MEKFFEDKNQYIYYETFINPVLYETWNSYFNHNNKFSSYQSLIIGSKYVIKVLTETKDDSFKDSCYRILDDIYNFLICSIYDFNKYKQIITEDFNFLFEELTNQTFKITLYNIYCSIIYFVSIQQQLYKHIYYLSDGIDCIDDSDDELDMEQFDLYYNDNYLFF